MLASPWGIYTVTKITVSDVAKKLEKQFRNPAISFNTDKGREHVSEFVFWERFSTAEIKARIK